MGGSPDKQVKNRARGPSLGAWPNRSIFSPSDLGGAVLARMRRSGGAILEGLDPGPARRRRPDRATSRGTDASMLVSVGIRMLSRASTRPAWSSASPASRWLRRWAIRGIVFQAARHPTAGPPAHIYQSRQETITSRTAGGLVKQLKTGQSAQMQSSVTRLAGSG